jgi:hypothetical protein
MYHLSLCIDCKRDEHGQLALFLLTAFALVEAYLRRETSALATL